MPELTVPGATPVTLHYEDAGGNGRPVVLIHGWPLSGAAWAGTVAALKEHGFRPITYDRRGFGQSSKPKTGNDYDTLAADLAALMDTLDLRDAVIVGFSMGGGEVARYIGRYGENRLAGAVLASAITPALMITDNNPDGAMPASGFTGLQDQCRADRHSFVKSFMTTFFSTAVDGLQVTQAELSEALAITEQAEDTALVETIWIWGTDLRTDLAKLTVPLLVIHGDGDQTVPFKASGERTHATVDGSRLYVIQGGPHGINVTHADEFNTALINFLDEL